MWVLWRLGSDVLSSGLCALVSTGRIGEFGMAVCDCGYGQNGCVLFLWFGGNLRLVVSWIWVFVGCRVDL